MSEQPNDAGRASKDASLVSLGFTRVSIWGRTYWSHPRTHAYIPEEELFALLDSGRSPLAAGKKE